MEGKVRNIEQAGVIARGDERAAEMAAVNLDSRRNIVALEAAAKAEIAKLEGTAAEKKKRTLAIEQELAAEVALLKQEALQKQGELFDNYNEQDYKRQEEFIGKQVEAIEEEDARRQAAFDAMLDAGLLSQQAADEARYEARKAALEKELALLEASLGTESKAYKKGYADWLKNETEFNKKAVADREQAAKARQRLQQLEMQTAGDVLSFGLELLDQDAEARKKHHTLYAALAAAKIIIDGTKEVQQIWEYSAENPANGPTAGAAGIAMGAIQTALAIGRTALALSKLGAGGSSGGGGSYWVGGATGDGGKLAVSPMGQLLQLSGMSVGSDGSLQDGSGHAVAGIVHANEYVIPAWQRADPQVAAVEQWLEARRLRGFADGGATTSPGPALPVPVASPASDGEKLYAVLTQMLAESRAMNERLAGVEQWQRELQVVNNLRDTRQGLDALKQTKQRGAIRSSR